MRFLLRSAFWLGLVYSQIPWPQDPAPALPAAAGASAAIAAKACGEKPRACLSAASAMLAAR